MADKKFDDAEFARTVERVADDQDIADWSNPTPRFDPKLHKDVREDALHGRKASDFRQALEGAGFKWVPKERLGPFGDGRWNDGSLHREGMWVSRSLNASFTEDDIVMYFPDGPEELWKWAAARRVTIAQKYRSS